MSTEVSETNLSLTQLILLIKLRQQLMRLNAWKLRKNSMSIANVKLTVENELDEGLLEVKVQKFCQIFLEKSIKKILLVNPPDGDEKLFWLSTAKKTVPNLPAVWQLLLLVD